jgi:hypothetical protein
MFNIFKKSVALVVAGLVVAICLFAQSSVVSQNGFLFTFFNHCQDLFIEPQTQWLSYVCLCGYVIVLIAVEWRPRTPGFDWLHETSAWLCLLVVTATINYFLGYPSGVDPAGALTLLLGVILTRFLATCLAWRGISEFDANGYFILVPLLILLSLESLPQAGHFFKRFLYQGQPRWSGHWNAPNIYGLLMACGMILAMGVLGTQAARQAGFKDEMRTVRRYGIMLLCLVAIVSMGSGLLHSYSRGAWLAMPFGLACLLVSGSGFWSRALGHWLRRNAAILLVILGSSLVLACYHFQNSEWSLVRRAFSSANLSDFSWRNRVAAWEGTMQIIAEHPCCGVGWNQPEPLYDHYYLPPRLNESAAVEMNDWLMLGATLGTPALFCFGMYLWLSLMQKSGARSQESEVKKTERGKYRSPKEGILETETDRTLCSSLEFMSSQSICRAGAIVLVVGFWFDGGLFKLATGSIFWILLELGREDSPQAT